MKCLLLVSFLVFSFIKTNQTEVPLYKPIVPGGVFFLVLCRLRIYHDSNYINICRIIAGRH